MGGQQIGRDREPDGLPNIKFGRFPLEGHLLLTPAGFRSRKFCLSSLCGSCRITGGELRVCKLLPQFLHDLDRFGVRDNFTTIPPFGGLNTLLQLLEFPLSRGLSVLDTPFGGTHVGDGILQKLLVFGPGFTLVLQVLLDSGERLASLAQLTLHCFEFLAQGSLIRLETEVSCPVRPQRVDPLPRRLRFAIQWTP